jgi:hypothetical protein
MVGTKTDLPFLEAQFYNSINRIMLLSNKQTAFRKAFFRVPRTVSSKSICGDPGSTLAPETVTPRQF